MNVLKKIFIHILVCVFIFSFGFIFGKYQSTSKHNADIAVYENRLADITSLNQQLKDENKRVTELNNGLTKRIESITARLDSAKTIIDGLDDQTGSNGETVQRLIDNVSRLEQALSIIFTGK